MQHSTSRSSSGSAQPVSSPPPYTVNPLATGTRGSSSTGTQLLPPLLAQMARQFNLPEATVDIARRGSEANLILSALALSFQELQAEVEQLRTENAALQLAVDNQANGVCPLIDHHRLSFASNECTGALIRAAERGDQHVMELILSHVGVDVNVENDRQRTALHFAARDNYKVVLRKLLQHPDIDSDHKDFHGSTALLLAAENGHVEIVRMLLEDGAVDVNARDGDGDSPLSCAAMAGHAAVLGLLLEHSGDAIDVNTTDNGGRTPLSWAADACGPTRYLHAENLRKKEAEAYTIVQLLLQRNDIDVNRPDMLGRTPLTYALIAGFGDVCRLLRASGAR